MLTEYMPRLAMPWRVEECCMRHDFPGLGAARATWRTFAVAMMCGTTLASAQLPGNPDAYGEGFEHIALGTANLAVGNDGTTVIVQNVGFNGGNGVEVRAPTGKGKGARLNLGPLLSTPGASATVQFLDFSGHAQCTRTITSSGNGIDHSTFDFSGIGAVSVTIDEYGDDGRLISSKTFAGPVGEKSWTPAAMCADGSSTLESVRWTKDCSTCTPVLEIERVCPSDGAGWLSGTPRAKIVVRGDQPTQHQFGDVIDSMIVTASGIPSFEVVERHIETFGAKVKGTGGAHLTEACPEGAVCADQARAHVHIDHIGASGEDGVSIATPLASRLRIRKKPSEAYQPWDDLLRIVTFSPHWSAARSIACRSSVAQSGTPGGTMTLTFDGSELGSSSIVLTTRLDGVITGVASGESASIRLSVGATDWLALDPIFTGEVGTRLRSGVIAEVGAGRPATVGREMVIQHGLESIEVIANSVTVEIIGQGQAGGITGGVVAGRIPSGGAFDISDVSWVLVCSGDLNGDGFVEDSDFVIFAGAYDILVCDDPAMASGCPADLNADGMVDDQDFVLFAKAYDQLLCP